MKLSSSSETFPSYPRLFFLGDLDEVSFCLRSTNISENKTGRSGEIPFKFAKLTFPLHSADKNWLRLLHYRIVIPLRRKS